MFYLPLDFGKYVNRIVSMKQFSFPATVAE
jgi:hypothetical protein